MNNSTLNESALATLDRHGLRPDTYKVALGSALLWTSRSETELHRLMSLSGLSTDTGKAFSAGDVKLAVSQLRDSALLVDDRQRPAAFQLVDSLRVPLYRQLLETHEGDRLARVVARIDGADPAQARPGHHWPLGGPPTSVAYVRAKFLSGAPSEELTHLRNIVARSTDWGSVLSKALLSAFDSASFARIEPNWRWQIAYQAVATICVYWADEYAPVADWAFAQLAERPEDLTTGLREVLGDLALQRGDRTAFELAVRGLDNGLANAMRAAQLAIDGQWAAAQVAFEAALKQRKSEIGGHKHFLPNSYAWFYPLALLAQQTPKHLEVARKFCLGESGRREPQPYDNWGSWAHAIDVRLGRSAVVSYAFRPPANAGGRLRLDSLWTMLLVAWLGGEVIAPSDPGLPAIDWRDTINALRKQLTDCRLNALLRLVDGAQAVLEGRDPPSGFFIAGPGEQWQEILAALQALGDEQALDAGGEATRLLWALEIDRQGKLLAINPLEQKRGARGWSRPRAIGLARIAGNEKLPTWDAKVARALRSEPAYRNRYRLDLAAAIVALVGHPCVVLAESPEQLVELTEAAPELELIRQGDRFVMRVDPPLRLSDGAATYSPSAEERREAEALSLITVLPDGSQRLKLVRFTAIQRQAAQLVAGRFAVPTDAPEAQPALERTLRALAAHFQIHADSTQAARQVSSDSRLHAELSPTGDDLSLRLVVAPLGAEGPRLPPGTGRLRLLAVQGSETVGTERDLTSERRHLDSVLDALPFLDSGEDINEWLIEDPEQALDLVETLPTLPAIAAVEWPKGKSVRVITVDTRQLGMRIRRERDWFRLSGQARLDEGLVLELEALLGAARAKTRFVPMGNGVYAALTRSLRQKLGDLAAVLETDKDGNKVPTIAAAWLDEVLEGTETEASKDFRQAIDRLRSAQAVEPKVPSLLQATLRPYQEDGYQWAIRLATAGMGGCLADDMGLGKTLQALGVLLERAAGGPALVIAPTSVCGNWLAEAQRFAPTLNVRVYGEAADGERDELVSQARPQDVVIVSYTLLLLAQERFAGRCWHTLVADEAQAIKNAAAKRSQAVFDLVADFRLAMTGTPVENRLADLWSIMRFANPGLLGSVHRFNERFASPIERHRDREAQHVLKRLVGPFILRRTKSEVLQDLPARTELILTVAPEAAEAAHYEALRRAAADEIDRTLGDAPEAEARFNILAQLTRLRRAACDPRLCNPQFGITGAKVQAFAELASELIANGHKALVFSQFVDFLQVLREPLDEAGVRYQYLDGATPAAERSRRVAAFQAGDGDLFLISLKAGGFGLNLTAADYVVITDPWWNPAAEDQAMGRAHRIGQLRPVTVYRLVTRGTVEERIVDLHHEKRALADSILAEGEASALPSTEDLVALIRGQ